MLQTSAIQPTAAKPGITPASGKPSDVHPVTPQTVTPPMTPPKPMTPAALPPVTEGGRPGLSNPQTVTPPVTPPATPAAAPGITAAAPPASVGYGQTQAITPGQDLRGQSITPGAESNRYDLAKQYLDTYQQSQLPQFQAGLRGIVQNNAAVGRLGSGMLNTDVGNLDLAQQQDYNTHAQNFLTDALGLQIGDNAGYRDELRGERGYQNGLENQAYDRSRQGVMDAENLKNSAFGRGATMAQLGLQDNPSGAQQTASNYYGQQAAAGGQALGGLIQGTTTQNEILKALGISDPSLELPNSGVTPEFAYPGLPG